LIPLPPFGLGVWSLFNDRVDESSRKVFRLLCDKEWSRMILRGGDVSRPHGLPRRRCKRNGYQPGSASAFRQAN